MIGETVSHYRILSKLGLGGMGVVYLAEDTHLARRVAIKFSTASKDNDSYHTRFLREARAASALSHPHIARIYDYGESAAGQPFIVMELVTGEDLAHRLHRQPMPPLQALRIAEEVAEALAEAHRNGIIHRDIKPSNIVINERGEVKVLDFGLAKQYQDPTETGLDKPTIATSQTVEGTVLGTPSYMSPEQARDGPLAPRSDLFALGAVLYECLAGRPAFTGANSVEILAGVLHLEPAPPSRFNPSLPPELDRTVAKALAKKPEERYQSAHELLADLRAAREAMKQPESQETEVLPTRGASLPAAAPITIWRSLQTLTAPLHKSRAAAIGLVALLAATILGAWWLMSDGTYRATPDAQRRYRDGLSALRDGTYDRASKALEQAVSLDPHFALARARLAEAYLELDLTDKAKEEMLQAAPPGTSPQLSRAEQQYVKALHLTLTGKFADAVAIYRDQISRAPESEKADAYLDLGRAYEKNEQTKDAVEAYQEATRRQPSNPAAWLHLAILYGRQMNQAKATEAFDRADNLYRGLGIQEGVTEVLLQRAVLANRLGNGDQARTLLSQALDLSTHIHSIAQQILSLLQLSAAEYRATHFADAQADAAKAIDLARASGLENLTTRGLVDLGNAYFLKGEADEARKYFTQSLDYARRYHSERNQARALFSLGSLAMRYGQVDEAMKDVQQAFEWYQRGGYQKESAQALILLARAQRQKGNYEGALQSFTQQLEIARKLGDASQVAVAQQGRGTVMQAQGRLPEALSSFREAYDAARQSGDQLNAEYDALDAAEIYWKLGRYKETVRSLDDAGPSASRAVLSLAEQIRAGMALSQRNFPLALETSRHALAQTGLSIDLTAGLKCILGSAQLASNARREGLAAVAEGAQLAEKSGAGLLIADTRLAHAEALLLSGDTPRAMEAAKASQQWFAGAGNQEAEWRSWLVVASAQAAAGRASESRESAHKAAQLLATLQQKWDSDNYKSYLTRPDIQNRRTQLTKLGGTQ